MPLRLTGSTSGYSQLDAPAIAGDQTFTLPSTGGTLVSTAGTQTLTNKTIQGGAITSGTAVASTSGTAIDFTGIPSWVKRVTVMFDGVSTNGSSLLLIQLGDSGGIETTSYNSSASWSSSAGSFASSTAGFLVEPTNIGAASTIRYGLWTIAKLTGNTYAFSGVQAGGSVGSASAGAKTLSDTLTQLRITPTNGTDTFDAGTINILYEG